MRCGSPREDPGAPMTTTPRFTATCESIRTASPELPRVLVEVQWREAARRLLRRGKVHPITEAEVSRLVHERPGDVQTEIARATEIALNRKG
jgi:hypothetical protein